MNISLLWSNLLHNAFRIVQAIKTVHDQKIVIVGITNSCQYCLFLHCVAGFSHSVSLTLVNSLCSIQVRLIYLIQSVCNDSITTIQ